MKKITLTIPINLHNQRLDFALSQLLPEYSRSQLSKWVKGQKVCVAGVAEDKISPKLAVQSEQFVEVIIPEEKNIDDVSEPIELDIVHEDEDILVLNKPAGLTVHPGAGQARHTLLNALLHHHACFEQLPRAGIVHRLDKLTSGLMVIAKNLKAQTSLVRQLQERSVSRRYLAIVNYVPITAFSCSLSIGRHPHQRIKMAALEHGGKSAHTDFSIIKKYRKHALLEATLSTGRTHQIRVHLSHMGYPIIGDAVYGKRVVLAKNMADDIITTLQKLKNQALHAHYLQLKHPQSNEQMKFNSPLPIDLQYIVDSLAEDYQSSL